MIWHSITLEQGAEPSSGTWGKPPAGDETDTPVLRSTNIHDGRLVLEDIAMRSLTPKLVARYRVQDGDIIVTTSSGSSQLIGKCTIFNQPNDGRIYAFSNFTLRLRPRRALVVPRYLFYYLLSPIAKNELERTHTTTSGLRNLNVGLYMQQPLPWTGKTEQRRIVEILDQADALRKKRAEANTKAARILPALVYKMFGDPATNPKGWPVKRLGDPLVATVNPRFSANGLPLETDLSFVPMADVDEIWGRIVGRQVRPYSSVMRGFTPFQENDVLFAKITPCMQNGKAAIARNLVGGRGFGSTEFHVLRAGTEATPEWLYALVRMSWFRRQAESSFTGTAGQQRVPADFLARYAVPCPFVELQNAFAKAVNRMGEWVDRIDQSSRSVDGLFSVLLHRAFTGDLTAKWREAHMKELLSEMESQSKAMAGLEPCSAGRDRKRRGA